MTERRHREPLPLGGEEGVPFSKGLLARHLVAAGVRADRAYELASRCEADLTATGRTALTLDRLDELALETLGNEQGANVARQLRLYRQVSELELPLLIPGGGAPGGGMWWGARALA